VLASTVAPPWGPAQAIRAECDRARTPRLAAHLGSSGTQGAGARLSADPARPGAMQRRRDRRRARACGTRRPGELSPARYLHDVLLLRVWDLRHNPTAYDAVDGQQGYEEGRRNVPEPGQEKAKVDEVVLLLTQPGAIFQEGASAHYSLR